MCEEFDLVSVTSETSHSRELRVSQCLICANYKSDTQHSQDGGEKSCLNRRNWHFDKNTHVPRKNHCEASY